jgi:hypothetical protein
MWAGETVAVIGAGPGMTVEVADQYREYKTIAANRALRFAPWADMFVCIDTDAAFWEGEEVKAFDGIKVCGTVCDIDARYVGMHYEKVQTHDGELHIRNNALEAMRIAASSGAAKIILAGIDPEAYQEIHGVTGFRGLAEGLQQVIDNLRSSGVEVEWT